jgi:hypothetical protein
MQCDGHEQTDIIGSGRLPGGGLRLATIDSSPQLEEKSGKSRERTVDQSSSRSEGKLESQDEQEFSGIEVV